MNTTSEERPPFSPKSLNMQRFRWKVQSISNAKVILFTLLLSSVLFGLNYYHQDQQGGIFYGRYLVLSESIRDLAYSYPGQEGVAATYPIWGYPILMAVLNPLLGIQGVYIFQYVLLLVSFWLVYRYFDLPRWNIPFKMALFHGALIAYAMALSVKWPMAIVAFLLLVFGLLHQRGRCGLASLTLLLAIHFRSEALLMWAVYVGFLLVQSTRGNIRYRELLQTRKNLYGLFLLGTCSLILLTSWPLYQYSQHRQLLLGTSNSGGTLYSGLGQLPNNPWNRIFADRICPVSGGRGRLGPRRKQGPDPPVPTGCIGTSHRLPREGAIQPAKDSDGRVLHG